MTSPSTLTFGAVKASSVVNISGVCAESGEFTGQLNEAVSRLMDAGDWWTTVVKARICIYQNCIAYPRWVGTVLATNICNQTRPIQNRWYSFMPISATDCLGRWKWKSNVTFVDDGMTPVFNNVPCGSGNYIRFYARHRADIDEAKTVHLFGTDSNGQTVMTKDADGNWYEGEILVLADPYVQSQAQFREVERVIKDVTSGPIDGYQYDATQDVLLELAHYEPSETNPMYRHATISGGGCCSGAGTGCTTSETKKVEILSKLQFIPVVADTDVVQIDNIPAIKLMVQAIRLEEAGDDDGAAKKQVLAIKELNRQLRNKLPIDQIPIDVSSCGTALPRLHGIGMMQ
jgi:hypothetical protein